MAFKETQQQHEARMENIPYLFIIDRATPGDPIRHIKETTQFKYLGYTLDQNLTGEHATNAMLLVRTCPGTL
jgi:hypothetical protein